MRLNVVSYYSVGRIISKKIVYSNAGLLSNQLQIIHTLLLGRISKVLGDHIEGYYRLTKKIPEKKIFE